MVRISDKAFGRVLTSVIDSLPDEFRVLLDRVPVIVDPYPSDEIFDAVEDADELFGLFVGPSVAEWESSDAPPETAVIYLFRETLEDACDSVKELEEQIRITLLHELGHCVGFDEDGLDRIGLA